MIILFRMPSDNYEEVESVTQRRAKYEQLFQGISEAAEEFRSSYELSKATGNAGILLVMRLLISSI
jgi:hypothetical protein